MKHLLCFGFGYSAAAVAVRLRSAGWEVSGTSRSVEGARRITATGCNGVVFDGKTACPGIAELLTTATHILISASPDERGDPVLSCHHDDIASAGTISWIGYLSTIGVYGDHGGAWIDEGAQLNGQSQRARRRIEAEAEWLTFGKDTGKKVQVFRLAGIYGPGRSAIDNLRAGTARRIVKPGQIFNRIHIDDIANVILVAITKDVSHQIFNVTDDEPAPPQDVVAYGAELLGVDPPPEIPFDEADLSPMARSFYADQKRVLNERITEDLEVRLLYPTYRDGLQAIVRQKRG